MHSCWKDPQCKLVKVSEKKQSGALQPGNLKDAFTVLNLILSFVFLKDELKNLGNKIYLKVYFIFPFQFKYFKHKGMRNTRIYNNLLREFLF